MDERTKRLWESGAKTCCFAFRDATFIENMRVAYRALGAPE
jgi:hypothetical protein